MNDTDAARRARRKAIKEDLAEVYSDDEAHPPEWVDLISEIREGAERIPIDVARETDRFVNEPDIRVALDRRERFSAKVREEIAKHNQKVRRLNLIAPNPRFTRGTIDADVTLRPLYRATRNVSSDR